MQTMSLCELYDGLYDGPHATPKPSDAGPVFLGIKNITVDGRLDLSNVRHISEDEFGKWTKRVTPQEGDIVFSYEATLHRYAIIPKGFHGCLGRRMALIRPNNKKVNTEYLFNYFFSEQWRTEVSKYILAGATVDRIPLTKVPDFQVTVHNRDEQDEVAEVISNYNNLIENNNCRIAILEDMAQSLYREWFVKFRFPGYQNSKFKDKLAGEPICNAKGDREAANAKDGMSESSLGLIPEGWEVKSFGELVGFKRDSVKKGSVEKDTPYMGLEHFPRKSIALSVWELVDEIGSSKLKFKKGDVLFGKIRPYFHKVGVAQTEGLCSSDTFVWRAIKDNFNTLVTCIASSDAFVAHSTQTSQGTKMPRANWNVLKEYGVCIPDNDLLDKFQGATGPMIKQIIVLSNKQRNLQKQRDLLLPKLISGKMEL